VVTPASSTPQVQARNAWAPRGGPPRMESYVAFFSVGRNSNELCSGPPIRIMSNPNRGRGRGMNGNPQFDRTREGSPDAPPAASPTFNPRVQAHQRGFPSNRGSGGTNISSQGQNRTGDSSPNLAAAQQATRGRGAGSIPSRGMERGRRPFGRGRGRGSQTPQGDSVTSS
jgi:hypothetical protein